MTQLNLHKIEKKILLSLVNNDGIEIEKLATLTNLSLDNVRRGIEWLKYKGLVCVSIQKESILELTSESQNKNPNEKIQRTDFVTLPERRIRHSEDYK
jgi:predicted transcriptional regulator